MPSRRPVRFEKSFDGWEKGKMTMDTKSTKPRLPDCTREEFIEMRKALGLTLSELAQVLDTDPKSLRYIEADPRSNMFRKPAPRMVRLMEAYLAGYRPADWPTDR